PHTIFDRFAPSDGYLGADEWGKEECVEEWLGDAFELAFSDGVWHMRVESPQAAWELMSEGAPPIKALLDTLDPERRQELRAAMLDFWKTFETADGVDEPRPFLIVEGRRR